MRRSDIAARGRRGLLCLSGAVMLLGLLAGCGHTKRSRVQGYVEGEFVYVSSQLAGPLQSLNVQRGAQVKAADPLFRTRPHGGKSGT